MISKDPNSREAEQVRERSTKQEDVWRYVVCVETQVVDCQRVPQ